MKKTVTMDYDELQQLNSRLAELESVVKAFNDSGKIIVKEYKIDLYGYRMDKPRYTITDKHEILKELNDRVIEQSETIKKIDKENAALVRKYKNIVFHKADIFDFFKKDRAVFIANKLSLNEDVFIKSVDELQDTLCKK